MNAPEPICPAQPTTTPLLTVLHEAGFVVCVLVTFLIGTKLISRGVAWYGQKLPRVIEPERNFVPLVAQLLDSLLLVACTGWLFWHFGLDATRALQTLAIFALAVSLSLKASVENFWSGYLILFGRPFRPHDRVMLPFVQVYEQPVVGEVVAIGKRATSVRLDNGATVHVPNADLVNHSVINLTFPGGGLMPRVKVEQDHPLSMNEAKLRLDRMRATLAERYSIEMNWVSDTRAEIKGKAINGMLVSEPNKVNVELDLSWYMTPMKKRVEDGVRDELEKLLLT